MMKIVMMLAVIVADGDDDVMLLPCPEPSNADSRGS